MSEPRPNAMHERRSSLVSVTAALALVLLGLPTLYVGGYFALGIDYADIPPRGREFPNRTLARFYAPMIQLESAIRAKRGRAVRE
jgi:hypothetical protein